MIVEPPWTILPALHVGDDGAEDADRIDAAVAVEAAILDRDRRLRHPRADRAARNGRPVLLGRDRAEQAAVGRVDERVLADRDRTERAEVATDPAQDDRAADGRGDEQHRDDDDRRDEQPLARVAPLSPAPACRTGARRDMRAAASARGPGAGHPIISDTVARPARPSRLPSTRRLSRPGARILRTAAGAGPRSRPRPDASSRCRPRRASSREGRSRPRGAPGSRSAPRRCP